MAGEKRREALKRQLPQLSGVKELDISLERNKGSVLESMPREAKLLVLTLNDTYSRNSSSPDDKLADTLMTHTAFQHLVVLNCEGIWRRHNEVDEVTRLVSHLPKTLRSLNLKGCQLTRAHIPPLQNICGQLEVLQLGSFRERDTMPCDKLSLKDVEEIVLGEGSRTLRKLDIHTLNLEKRQSLEGPRLLSHDSLPLEIVLVAVRVEKLSEWGCFGEWGNRWWLVRTAK